MSEIVKAHLSRKNELANNFSATNELTKCLNGTDAYANIPLDKRPSICNKYKSPPCKKGDAATCINEFDATLISHVIWKNGYMDESVSKQIIKNIDECQKQGTPNDACFKLLDAVENYPRVINKVDTGNDTGNVAANNGDALYGTSHYMGAFYALQKGNPRDSGHVARSINLTKCIYDASYNENTKQYNFDSSKLCGCANKYQWHKCSNNSANQPKYCMTQTDGSLDSTAKMPIVDIKNDNRCFRYNGETIQKACPAGYECSSDDNQNWSCKTKPTAGQSANNLVVTNYNCRAGTETTI